MKRLLIVLGVLVLLAFVAAALFFFVPAGLAPVRASAAQPSGRALIDKGRYLATAGDCVACHSVAGGKPFAGGLAFKLPFGTIYSSNITPDRKTGIGGWSAAEFVRAMRHGIRKDGQNLYPAFPYPSYAHLSTDDLLAIRAYLNTLAPQAVAIQPNALSFPFNQRRLMRAWNLLYLPRQPLQPDPQRSAEWNRGAYLVEGAGHCGECHTTRNLIYGYKAGHKFAGETAQGWKAYNITSDPKAGIGAWSVDEIASYLSTGYAQGRGAASGNMAEAIELSLSHLTAQDVHAMAVYLKTVPARGRGDGINPNPAPLAASTAFAPGRDELHTAGRRLFEGACASCHAWNGEGLQTPYAALRATQSVNDPEATNVIQVILRGSHLTTAAGTVSMPSFGRAYSDGEIAALSNYVLAHFGGRDAGITPRQVRKARAAGQ